LRSIMNPPFLIEGLAAVRKYSERALMLSHNQYGYSGA